MTTPTTHMEIAPARWVELLALTALALLSLVIIATELQRVLPAQELRDFGTFFASAKAAAEGLNPYGIYPLTYHAVIPGYEGWNENLNPPISALLFQPFTLLDPDTSFRVWRGISLATYLAAVGLLLWRYARGFEAILLLPLCLGLAGVWDTLLLGQIYTPLVLCAVSAWLLLERDRFIWAGLLIGILIAMKPNFLVWPVLLFLSGHHRPALVSGAAAGLISLVPVIVFGPEVYQQWLDVIVPDGDGKAFPTNVSFVGLAARAGVPMFGLYLSIGLLLALAAWAVWRRPEPMRASEMALLAAVLASPLGWIHYTLFFIPVLLSRRMQPAIWITLLVLIIPPSVIIEQTAQSPAMQLTISSAYAWASILCLIAVWAEEPEWLRPRTGSAGPVPDIGRTTPFPE